MKIELKKIYFSRQFSEQTHAFLADVYVEGIKAASACNWGIGSPTTYQAYDERGSKLIDDAEIYCLSLPPQKLSVDNVNSEFKMNLKRYIDNLLYKHLEEKEIQRFRRTIARGMKRGIVIGIPDKIFKLWQFKLPIDELLQHPKGPDFIKNVITKYIIPELTEGKIIMNTNIPSTLLEQAGLKKSQYAEDTAMKQKETENKPLRKGRKL